MNNRLSVRLAAALAVLLQAGCTSVQNAVLQPACAVQHRPAADYGPASLESSTSSVDIEISGSYVRRRLQAQFDPPLPDLVTDQDLAVPEGQPNAIPRGGVLVQSARLEEQVAGMERLHILTIRLTPWLLHQESAQGQWKLSKTEVDRFFDLRLRLAPRLITPTTVPDPDRRRALLRCGTDPNCGRNGAIVPLELYELYDVTNGHTVACGGEEYDIVTQQVHQGVLDALYGTEQKEGAPPLVLPAQTIVELVSRIANAPLRLAGIALGTDQNLKIGLRLDQGPAESFDPATEVGAQLSDWRVRIDTSFITAAVVKKVRDKAAAHSPPIAVGDISVSYTRRLATTPPARSVLVVDAPATATTLGCVVPVHIHVEIALDVRRGAADSSFIIAKDTTSADPTLTFCIVFNSLLYGQSTMVICTDGRCPGATPPDPCPRMAAVQFAVGPGDVFYGVAMNSDNTFAILGRSTLVDASLPPGDRPPVASCP
jgi:hypothetical protein